MNGNSSSRNIKEELEASASTSTNHALGLEVLVTDDDDDDRRGSSESETTKTVPFLKLFSFADSDDIVLMVVGSIGAIGNGVCLPLMTILFGDLINSFGQNQTNSQVVRVVSKVIKCP